MFFHNDELSELLELMDVLPHSDELSKLLELMDVLERI